MKNLLDIQGAVHICDQDRNDEVLDGPVYIVSNVKRRGPGDLQLQKSFKL